MKKLYFIGVILSCVLAANLFGGAVFTQPDISIRRITQAPFNLGTATNVTGGDITTWVKSVTNLAVAFQTTNLIPGVTYEIRLHNRGATATPNVTITAESGQVFSVPNVTAAQTITYGSPIANATLRILVTAGEEGTNYLDFRDNYK